MTRRDSYSPIARAVPFDNSTNGFTSDNVQDAIEEVQNESNESRFLNFTFVNSGNTSDKWLGYSHSAAPSNEIPFVCAYDIEIVGAIFSNRDNDVDTDIKLYKNGSLLFTWEIRNKRTSFKTDISPRPQFSQGDRMSVFLKKYTGGTGDSTAQDPLVEFLGRIVTVVEDEGGTQNGV